MRPIHYLRPLCGIGLTLCLLAVSPGEAAARPRPEHGTTTPFEANKTFGLGLIVGGPLGLSAKYYLTDSTALDFALGEYYHYHYDDALGIHMDFLWHPLVLVETDPFILPLYFGIGGRLLDDQNYDRAGDDDVHLGVRAPVGVLFDFNRVPIDIFVELALIIDFVHERDRDDVFLDLAAGFRYYF